MERLLENFSESARQQKQKGKETLHTITTREQIGQE